MSDQPSNPVPQIETDNNEEGESKGIATLMQQITIDTIEDEESDDTVDLKFFYKDYIEACFEINKPAEMEMRLRYAKNIEKLVKQNETMQDIFIYIAKMLDMSLPVNKIDPVTREIVSYTIKISDGSVFSPNEMAYLAVLMRKKIDEHINQFNKINSTISGFQQTIELNKKEVKSQHQQIQSLMQKTKYPSLEEKPYLIAYLNDKGNFVFLGKKESKKHPGKMLQARVKDFASANKYSNQREALVDLIALLKNRNSTITTAHLMNIYSAHLIPANVEDNWGLESIEKIRQDAEKYEELMKVPNAKKRKAKRNSKNKKS